jgi:ABC-type cobalamin/Fe3+-siderophores transport system ATPase subunit
MTNPFATRYIRPGAIPFLFPEGRSLEQLLADLAAQGYWGQIVGPHGSGKSTLLAQLVRALRQSGRSVALEALRLGQRRPPAWPPPSGTNIVAIDGYEQLAWLWRWRVKAWCRRHACGLLVTAHLDVGLPSLWTTSPDLATLQRIVDHLRSTTCPTPADGSGAPGAWFSREELAEALAAAQGNLREALFHLFDRYQQRSLAAIAASNPAGNQAGP